MFEKYNLNELYLGSINVMYPDSFDYDINIGGMLMVSAAGYGYWTILRKIGEDKFIDLQDPKKLISTVRNPRITSYTVGYIEPLSNYYVQDGKTNEVFSRRQAIKEAKNYYDAIHKKSLNLLNKEKMN